MNEHKKTRRQAGLFLLVKVMGIEPMSESTSPGASPSAADDLDFALEGVRQQTRSSAIL